MHVWFSVSPIGLFLEARSLHLVSTLTHGDPPHRFVEYRNCPNCFLPMVIALWESVRTSLEPVPFKMIDDLNKRGSPLQSRSEWKEHMRGKMWREIGRCLRYAGNDFENINIQHIIAAFLWRSLKISPCIECFAVVTGYPTHSYIFQFVASKNGILVKSRQTSLG